ncbi:MAG TPA: hypothetical protein VF841_04165, partial [Anaeromyxobacter sp.]
HLEAAPPGAPAVAAAEAPRRPRERRRVYTWIATGAAAAAVATGAYFGAAASHDADALRSMSQPDGPQARAYADGAQSNARRANALYAVAGAAAAAGVTLFFVERRF